MTIDITLKGWMLVPLFITLLAVVLVILALWKEDAPELAQLVCIAWVTHVGVSLFTSALLMWGAR